MISADHAAFPDRLSIFGDTGACATERSWRRLPVKIRRSEAMIRLFPVADQEGGCSKLGIAKINV